MKKTGFYQGVLCVCLVVLSVGLLRPLPVSGTKLPAGYWSVEKSSEILKKTFFLTLDPDLSSLTQGELKAVNKLIQVGHIFNRLYENSRHFQSTEALKKLVDLDQKTGSSIATQNLLSLYYLFKGPIGRTLDNTLAPFLPVEAKVPGKNVYPWGVTKGELDKFMANFPQERFQILHVRTVVRRTNLLNIKNDLKMLTLHSVLDTLHPGLKDKLLALKKNPGSRAFYAVPYSVAYAEELLEAYRLLNTAADDVESDDIEFSRYLRHRARDLLSNDYEAGDAAWITGRFNHLNAQIGSYEVYDDELYSVKSFFSLVLMIRDEKKSASLGSAIKGLQDFENDLPYEIRGSDGKPSGAHKRVREDIPVGVYNIIADFGQSRGTNTATILPNEGFISRKYGRTILMRYNIITHPHLFTIRKDAFRAAVMEMFHDDFDINGNFYRTLWHEIGHYLGPDLTIDGKSPDDVLLEISQVLEELKADLISLFLAKSLREMSYFDDKALKGVYSSGIRRVLLKNKPRRSQPYQTMELMQFNYFLEQGLLEFDNQVNKLKIRYERYHQTVASMLKTVLALQYKGDRAAANRFIDNYTTWKNEVHGSIAQSMRETERFRFAIVKYKALSDQ